MAFHTGDMAAPAQSWRTVVPSDTVNLPAGCRGLYVGGAGDVVAVGADNVAGTFPAVPAGTTIPIGPKRINLTGTTATLVLALY